MHDRSKHSHVGSCINNDSKHQTPYEDKNEKYTCHVSERAETGTEVIIEKLLNLLLQTKCAM